MNTALENFSEYIKPYLLDIIAIKTDKKVIRKGKLKIFQVKQHYARLTLEDGERTRIYEIPYPYDISKEGNRGGCKVKIFCKNCCRAGFFV